MIEGDITISRHAFGQLAEMLERLEDQTLQVHEEMSVLRQLTLMVLDMSSTVS